MDKKQHLAWIDLEMTGLSPEADRIIEIATIITNTDLDIVAEGPSLAVYQSDDILDKMDDWNQRQHGKSGLIERVRVSSLVERDAERQTIEFLSGFVEPGFSPMCGNSICQDRRFLARYMPELESFFHYRNLDVSSVKELARRWRPELADELNKEGRHRALDDVKDSINELRHYRDHFFRLAK